MILDSRHSTRTSLFSDTFLRLWAGIAVIVLTVALASFRYTLCFNLIPLCFIGYAIIIRRHHTVKRSSLLTLAALSVLSTAFQIYHCIHFGVQLQFDSNEYVSLGQGLAAGNGLSGAVYRTPLYPLFVGLFLKAGDHSGMYVVIVQHIIVVLFVPVVYKLSRMFGFSEESAIIASALTAVNSLLVEAASLVMTEIFFCALSLISLAMLRRLFTAPGIRRSIAAGAAFAAATYCRPLFFPVLAIGLILLAIKKGRRGAVMAAIVLVVYLCVTTPWLLRNYAISGHHAMSASLGVQAFTKAITFKCLNATGPHYKRIEAPLLGVLRDLTVSGNEAAIFPEDDWKTNRIPHALMDSLTIRHGFSYFTAAELLKSAAFEGFLRYPARYLASVANSFTTLCISYRELYPDIRQLAPIDVTALPPMMQRILNGLVRVSGYFLLLFPIAAFIRRDKSEALFIPFAVVCAMYFLTAAVQIGFTRYTIPWLPLLAICAAYVIETVVIAGNKISCFIAKIKQTGPTVPLDGK
jgi:hypothetical protein